MVYILYLYLFISIPFFVVTAFIPSKKHYVFSAMLMEVIGMVCTIGLLIFIFSGDRDVSFVVDDILTAILGIVLLLGWSTLFLIDFLYFIILLLLGKRIELVNGFLGRNSQGAFSASSHRSSSGENATEEQNVYGDNIYGDNIHDDNIYGDNLNFDTKNENEATTVQTDQTAQSPERKRTPAQITLIMTLIAFGLFLATVLLAFF